MSGINNISTERVTIDEMITEISLLPPVDINFEMQLMRDQIGYDVLVDEYGWKI